MVEDGTSGNLSDFVNEEDYHFLRSNIGMNSFDMMTSTSMTEAGSLDPMMMTILNNEDTTLGMEEFKYINENGYLQPYPDFPPEEPGELCNSDYEGPLKFEVFVDPNGLKNPWEYSAVLNKIYIDIKHKFPINFSVKPQSTLDGKLFVRVMPMFAEDRYFHELVHRCICHEQQKDPMNHGIPELVTQHIIRCDNANARYCGDKSRGLRLSIVIPLSNPQAGTDSVKEFFQFVCKNSCVGGMNRRPIQVVFTLENEFGSVLGRRVLCVRICSCPKRDREKEELKKNEKQEKKPPGKKRKVEKKMASPAPSTDTDTDTDIIESDESSEESRIKDLMDSFPGILKSSLQELFNKCNKNFHVDLLLEDNNLEVTDITEEEQDEELVEESEPDSRQQNEEEIRKASTFKRKTISDDALELKKCLEEKIDINREHYSEHVFKVKQSKFGGYSQEPQPSTSAVIDQDSDLDFDHSDLSDDNPKNMIELNLGDAFVAQLETMFGGDDGAFPKGFQPVIQMPVSLARQIYSFYVESICQQMEATYYREQANKHLKRREELNEKAKSYYQRGMTEVAMFYSELAKKETKFYDKANHIAAAAFIDEHAKRLQKFDTLDLHYFYVKEAIPNLDIFIDRNINLLKGGTKRGQDLFVITGRGKNSEGGRCKIKPAVISRLKKRKISFVQLNPGLLKIKVLENSLMTSDLS